MMIYLKLFLSFLQIGMFSIGGGYAAMPLIQRQVVEVNKWLSMSEFTDLVTIAEMTPGPIAVNGATFVGTKIAGIPGMIVATVGCILPSCIVSSLLAYIYFRYKNGNALKSVLSSLRPAVVALIACAGILILKVVVFPETMALSAINYIGLILFIAAFFVLRKFKLSPILVMVVCGLSSLIVNLILRS